MTAYESRISDGSSDVCSSDLGLTTHPVIGATLYGVALLVVAFDLLPRAKSWRVRLAWLAVVALCAAFMVLSGSRGPLLALCAALVCGLAVPLGSASCRARVCQYV